MSAYSDEQLVLEALDDSRPAFEQLIKLQMNVTKSSYFFSYYSRTRLPARFRGTRCQPVSPNGLAASFY